MIAGPRARLLVLGAALPSVALFLGACSNDRIPTSAGITLPPQTVVLPSASARPATTVAPSTVPATAPVPGRQPAATTTTPATTVEATTTTAPPAPCDQTIVETDIGPAEDGYLFVDLRCDGPWASMVAQTQQPNFATDEPVLMHSDAGHWIVVAAGGVTTCESAGIPTESWNALGCSRWQR